MAKKSKKERLLERKRKLAIIKTAIEIHKKNKEDIEKNKAKGGWAEPNKEGLNEDWASKVGALHQKVSQGIEKSKQKRKKRLSRHLGR